MPAQAFTNSLTKYYYDPLYQLNRVDYPAPAPFSNEIDSWTYDAIGNRLTSVVNGTPQTYTYFKNGANPLNGQRLQNDGSNSYTWSSLGNLATRTGPGGNFTFGYDTALKNLAAITGGATASYTYDYQGRRSTKTAGATTTYLYDGQNLLSETKSGIPTYYLYGPGIDEPLAAYVTSGANSGFHYFNVDGLGSVVATNSPTGTVEHHAVFDAWGVTRSETGTRLHPFTYTGREVGEAGLHYYRARYLQPGVGRFTQEDPLDGAAAQAYLGGTLRQPRPYAFYGYARNSPAWYTDPFGLAALCGPPRPGCEQKCLADFAGRLKLCAAFFAAGTTACYIELAVCAPLTAGVGAPACYLSFLACEAVVTGLHFACDAGVELVHHKCLEACRQ